MPKYRVYGKVVGTKYLGEYEANSEDEAAAKADENCWVNVCHQCSEEIDDPEIQDVVVELVKE